MVLQMIKQGNELVHRGGQLHLDRHLQVRAGLPGREDLGAGHLDPVVLGQIFQDLLEIGGGHRRVGPGRNWPSVRARAAFMALLASTARSCCS